MKTGDLTKEVLRRLSLKGYQVWRTNAGRVRHNVRMAPPGTPDIVGYAIDGTFVAVEIKIDDDSPSGVQRKWLSRAESYGCYVATVWCKEDIDEIVLCWP